MIDCPFRTAQGTCQIVDNGVGSPVPVGEDACMFCIKSFPEPSLRHLSSAVESFTFIGLRQLGKKTPPLKAIGGYSQPKPTRPNRCEELGAKVKKAACSCPRKDVYTCKQFKDVGGNPLHVIPSGQCETCPNYTDSGESF